MYISISAKTWGKISKLSNIQFMEEKNPDVISLLATEPGRKTLKAKSNGRREKSFLESNYR